MKRPILLLAAGVLAFGLASCGEESVAYGVTVDVLGEGGRKGVTVSLVNSSGKSVASGTTARGGSVTLNAPKGEYSIVASDMPAGYYQTAEAKTSLDEANYTVNVSTKLIEGTPKEGSQFYKGDVLYDHSFRMVDGSTDSISAELKKHDACIINFWGTKCGVCCQELPHLNAFYEEMKEQVGLICVNSYYSETNEQITAFMTENGYSVPSTEFGWDYSNEMGVSGWPTTVVIDRYGRYATGVIGFDESISFHTLVDGLLGDSYVPSY